LTRPEGQILEIRPFVLSDVPQIVEAVNESLKELRAFMPWAHYPQTLENQRERVAGLFKSYWLGGDMSLGIFAGGRLLGGTGLHDRTLNTKGREIGYWCRTSEAGKGVVTASTQALIVYGFEHLGLTRIQCGHDTANVGSAKVNDRCGFKIDGTFKNFLSAPSSKMVEDGYKGTGDCVMRGLTPEDVPGLAWYADVKRRLQVYDWLGVLASP
jgi:RimJ/RimL family protein N-acetyltransferase